MQKVLLRYVAYTLAVAAVTILMLFVTAQVSGSLQPERVLAGGAIRTSEFWPVEILQNLLLVLCACLHAWVAWRDRLRRPMAVMLFALLLGCLIRELDFFLDYYVVDNLWQVLCAIVLAAALVYGVRERVVFVQGWRRSWPSAGLAMVLGGFILLVGFAQPVGNDAFWTAIAGEAPARLMKVAVEEFAELAGYALITIGSIEFVYAWSRLPRSRRKPG